MMYKNEYPRLHTHIIEKKSGILESGKRIGTGHASAGQNKRECVCKIDLTILEFGGIYPETVNELGIMENTTVSYGPIATNHTSQPLRLQKVKKKKRKKKKKRSDVKRVKLHTFGNS